MATGRRAVLLDRDGVVNPLWYDADHGLVDSPANPEQFSLLPGVGDAVRRLRGRGLAVVVISNQPGIAKGKLTPQLLDAITDKMVAELARDGAAVDAVFYCLHHPDAVVPAYRAACVCRKPGPGLLLQAGRELALDLGRSYMVGDGLTDIRAGRAAGCRTIWIGRRTCEVCQVMEREDAVPDLVAADLPEAVRLIEAEG